MNLIKLKLNLAILLLFENTILKQIWITIAFIKQSRSFQINTLATRYYFSFYERLLVTK